MPLKIRRFKPEDLPALHKLLSDPEVMRFLEPPFSLKKSTEFLQSAGLADSPLVYAVENANQDFIGYVIYHPYDSASMEIGWVLLPAFQKKGYAKELTRQLVEKAHARELDAILECVSQQKATIHIAQTFGFRPEGMQDGCLVFRHAAKDTQFGWPGKQEKQEEMKR